MLNFWKSEIVGQTDQWFLEPQIKENAVQIRIKSSEQEIKKSTTDQASINSHRWFQGMLETQVVRW